MADSEKTEIKIESKIEYGSDFLLEKSGFIRCQLAVGDHLIDLEKEMSEHLKALRRRLEGTNSLIQKQELALKVSKIAGLLEANRLLYEHISKLQLLPARQN